MDESPEKSEETISVSSKRQKIQGLTSNFIGYRVEAKVKFMSSIRLHFVKDCYGGNILLTDQWKTIDFPTREDDAGFPVGDPLFQEHGVYPYATAVGLAWQLLAKFSSNTVDVRVVPYLIVYTSKMYKYEDKAKIIGGDEFERIRAEAEYRMEKDESEKDQ